jgi:hypothetical protein
MTHDRHDPESIQDMTFVLARERIDHLRANASTIDTEATMPPATTSPGFVARTRDLIGRRLIALGGSLATDEALRRRALHL